MLLTGFDAPVEQVLYLDAPLREHTRLQAIARVNRPLGEEKTYGLVVDYWGVSAKLQDALAVFSTTDVQGALTPNVDAEENPAFYQSLRERLEEIIAERRQERLDAARQLELLSSLRDELKGEQAQADNLGLDARGFAIDGLLEQHRPMTTREDSPGAADDCPTISAAAPGGRRRWR